MSVTAQLTRTGNSVTVRIQDATCEAQVGLWSERLAGVAETQPGHKGHWHVETAITEPGLTLRCWCHSPVMHDPREMDAAQRAISDILTQAGYQVVGADGTAG